MGTMQYGSGSEIQIEDRALAHLKVAIATFRWAKIGRAHV